MKPSIEDIYSDHVWHVYAYFGYRVASREDAEDLTQVTFERAARAVARYDERRASVRTWLLAIAQNLLIDHHRRAGSRPTTVPLPDENFDLHDRVASKIDAPNLGLDPELATALSTLSDRDRQVIGLRYGAELTGPEIAALMDLSLANVQQILSRSLRRMRAAIEEQRGVSEG